MRLDVGDEVRRRLAARGDAEERHVAAKLGAGREALARVMREDDEAVSEQVFARGMLDGCKGLVVEEERLTLATAGRAVAGIALEFDIEQEHLAAGIVGELEPLAACRPVQLDVQRDREIGGRAAEVQDRAMRTAPAHGRDREVVDASQRFGDAVSRGGEDEGRGEPESERAAGELIVEGGPGRIGPPREVIVGQGEHQETASSTMIQSLSPFGGGHVHVPLLPATIRVALDSLPVAGSTSVARQAVPAPRSRTITGSA